MSAKRVINYYKVLAVPSDADLMGIENAYVRISDELASQADPDDNTGRALEQVNEAYSVLANAETRRQYDQVLFAAEYEALERRVLAEERRRKWARRILVGALCGVIVAQAVALYFVAGDTLDSISLSSIGL